MGSRNRLLPANLLAESNIYSSAYDCLLLVHWPEQTPKVDFLSSVIDGAIKTDPALKKEVAVLPLSSVPAGRLVFAPTGPLNKDYDDVRILGETTAKAIKRALKSGFKNPLLILQEHEDFQNAELVMLLAALEALYVPLQVREGKPSSSPKVDALGIYTDDPNKTAQLIRLASALESGRYVARDIGGSDPERMAPPKVQDYVEELFKDSNIKVQVISDIEVISKEFPLFEAVNRAASVVERHKGRIVFLEYVPKDASKVKESLFLVGKGVTYDTGGADIKAGGVMAGMSRDKCGAAAVAGFLQVVRELEPEELRVVGALSLVRNSVGSNGYVSDELIKARSGAFVRVGNTDAEGRMIMADVLCKLKESAVDAINPQLMTIATLTGHAVLAVGEGYSIAIDNAPARKEGTAYRLQTAGHAIGDPFEVSVLRREDLAFHRGKSEGEDIMQCNNLPSSRTPRGHQGPAAFLLLASGLDKHGTMDAKPLKYSHLDIAPSAGDLPNPATGAPILALSNAYLLNKI